MPEAVLFEFEGVLAQTHALRLAALNEAITSRGISQPPHSAELRLGARSAHAAVEILAAQGALRVDETELELIAIEAERTFARRAAAGLTLAPGARECVLRLQSSTRLGIVTRMGRAEVDGALSLAGLDFAFECIIAREDASLPKPYPHGHELAIERLSRRRPITPAAIVALEDGPAGIRAARAAGVVAIAVGDVPPHEAVEADGYLPALEAVTAAALEELLRGAERDS